MEISHTPHTYIYTSKNTYSCLEVRLKYIWIADVYTDVFSCSCLC